MVVSSLFKEKIYATEREVTAKVTFNIEDKEASQDVQVTALTTEASHSRKDQIVNGVRAVSHKYATFESGWFKLDGSVYIPPRPNEGNSEVGYWSDTIGYSTGLFSADPTIGLTFPTPMNSIGLTIIFDTVNQEWAKDFRIKAWNAQGEYIVNHFEANNQKIVYVFDKNLEEATSIQIEIVKWSRGYRRVKIAEISFGVMQEYTGAELINLNIVEETDLIGNTIPTNEISFTLDNKDRLFNILNPDGIYRFIKPRQVITASFGLKVSEDQYEWVSMGKYYLSEWKTDEGALTTSFIGRDIFETFETVEYKTSLKNTDLYNLASDIFGAVGIDNYQIDENLKNDLTYGFFEPINVRTALQNIAIAGKAVIYQDRAGTIIIEQIEPLTTGTGYITYTGDDVFAGVTTPEISNDYDFQAITFDNVFQEPQVAMNELVRSLTLNVYDDTGNSSEVTFTNPESDKGVAYKIEIPLINTTLQAQRVAEWMFTEYNMKAKYSANWRQNPALVCTNAIMIEDSFGAKKKSRITKQVYEFAGYLSGNTESVGGV